MKTFKTYFNLFLILFMSIFTSSILYCVEAESKSDCDFIEVKHISSELQERINQFNKFLKKEGIYHAYYDNLKNDISSCANFHKNDYLYFLNTCSPSKWIIDAFYWGSTKYPEYNKGIFKKYTLWENLSIKWEIIANKPVPKKKVYVVHQFIDENGNWKNRIELARSMGEQWVSIQHLTKEEIQSLKPGDRIMWKDIPTEYKLSTQVLNLLNSHTEVAIRNEKILEVTWLTKSK